MNDRNMPLGEKYIDLHYHLDGSVTADIAKRLAEIQGIKLPADSDEELERLLSVPPDCGSLNDFLACFELPLSLLQTKESLSECVYLEAEKMREQGVIYSEIRFAPQLHCRQGMTQEEAVQAALEGLKRTKLRANLILCCMRGRDTRKENLQTLELGRKYLTEDGGVTAIDLAGAEALFPTADYRELFGKARGYGIPFTIHAGEADGAESVRLAVEYGAARIGHGVRITEDPELMETIREKGIALELCPTSNRLTHAVEDMSKYPLGEFMDRGLRVTVNTDDMAVCRTDIAKEFAYAEQLFSLSDRQKNAILLNAADAAFTSEEVKGQLRRSLGSRQ